MIKRSGVRCCDSSISVTHVRITKMMTTTRGPSRSRTTNDNGETFNVLLTDPKGAGIDKGTATGTILNTETLTGNFESVPAEHDGSTAFTFYAAFTTDIAIGYAAMRDHAFTVTKGDVTKARRVDGRSDRWEITVDPDGDDAVTITLPANRACGTQGAICSKEDNPVQLSNNPSATIAGPPAEPRRSTAHGELLGRAGRAQRERFHVPADVQRGARRRLEGRQGTASVVKTTPTVSIAGGSGKEGDDDAIDFTVTLGEAASGTVTVDYATSDGSAEAGDDYTAKSGTLSFSAGETSKTVSVTIEDDIENESEETFTVTLSNASGADLGTASATGTIRNRQVAPLTATFSNVPAEHDGSEFTFDLAFSENVKAGYARLRDDAVRRDRSNDREGPAQDPGQQPNWTITVEPLGSNQITISLPATTDCDATGAICTDDGRKLSHSTSASVLGPVGDLHRRRGGRGRRRRGAGVQRRAHASGEQSADGRLRHVGRYRHRGRRLHRHERNAHDRCGKLIRHHPGTRDRRRAQRGLARRSP